MLIGFSTASCRCIMFLPFGGSVCYDGSNVSDLNYVSIPKTSLNTLCMFLYFGSTVKCRNMCVVFLQAMPCPHGKLSLSYSYRQYVSRMASCLCHSISVTVTCFGEPKVTNFLTEDIPLCFNPQKIKQFYSVETTIAYGHQHPSMATCFGLL